MITVDSAPFPQAGRVRSFVDFYLTTMRTAIATQFQYRAANYFYMLGMVAEPVIYLVVWTTIANSSGGSVNGISADEFAAYYIVWTLVGSMSTQSLLLGLGAQTLWIAGMFFVFRAAFRYAVRHYSAVGG